MAITIQLRRTQSSLSTLSTIIPAAGEPVYSFSDNVLVIGDGTKNLTQLPKIFTKTWQGDIIGISYGGTGNNTGYIRTGLKSGVTSGAKATAEGNNTSSTGANSHAEGDTTTSSGSASHSEGTSTIASGVNSHAEGTSTTASGNSSHAEGNSTTASGIYSHVEGSTNTASGQSSHSEGQGTKSKFRSQHVFGEYNIEDPASVQPTQRGTYVEIVGNGTSSTRSNVRTLDWSGNESISGNFIPMTNNSKSLGNSSKRWSSVWIGNADSYGSSNLPIYWNNGVPTPVSSLNVNTTGSAAKLTTARSLKVALGSTTNVTFDGSADQDSIPVSGTLAVANGGTGESSFTANSLIISGNSSNDPLTTRSITNNTTNTTIGSGTNIPTMNTLYYSMAMINNGSQSRAVSIYAPTSGGTINTQALVGAGATAAPKWVNISPSISITAGTSSSTPSINISVLGQNATSQNLNQASTSAYGVTKLSSTASSTEEGLAATPKGVDIAITSKIGTLDVSAQTGAASKTLTSISEIDGKISGVTYSDISINTSQISSGTMSINRLPSASTSAKGITYLTNTIDQNQTLAATPKGVQDAINSALSSSSLIKTAEKSWLHNATSTKSYINMTCFFNTLVILQCSFQIQGGSWYYQSNLPYEYQIDLNSYQFPGSSSKYYRVLDRSIPEEFRPTDVVRIGTLLINTGYSMENPVGIITPYGSFYLCQPSNGPDSGYTASVQGCMCYTKTMITGV